MMFVIFCVTCAAAFFIWDYFFYNKRNMSSSLPGVFCTLCVGAYFCWDYYHHKHVVFAATCIAAYFVWDYYHHKHFLPTPKEKCVFITGCDSGFGRALALKLNELGCYVYAGCFTENGMHDLENAGENIVAVHVDVSDTGSIKKAYHEVHNKLKERELWGVVNNAGIMGTGGPVEVTTREELLKCFNVNMVGMAEVGRIFLPLLKQSRGRLVNMVSIAGRVAGLDMGAYTASKYAMEGYSDTQRRELKRYGINVSILNPGLFRTGLLDPEVYKRAKTEQWENTEPEVREQLGGDKFLQGCTEAGIKIFCKKSSQDISPVIDAYVHALFAVYPRRRYLVGIDGFILGVLSLLPAQFLDNFLWKRGRPMAPTLNRQPVDELIMGNVQK